MSMQFERKLALPAEVKEMYPLSGKMNETVEKRNAQIKSIFEGRDRRLLLIIGPCSADNEDSVIDYTLRLKDIQEKVEDKIFIVPRIYTNKPRTTGAGYKGMLHQPDPNEKPDMFKGIIATRHLHMRAVEETGFSCADEMLYPENYQYLEDLLGYVAVGARSVEDQQHRLVASGISVPVGMKNPTSGDHAAQVAGHAGFQPQHAGDTHAILRGYTNKHGQALPNYHYEDLIRLYEDYQKGDYLNPAVIIDTNHGNSGKDPFEQPRIIKEVLYACRHNKDVGGMVKGFMVESYIEDGNQKVGGGVYGKSITDACLGWEKSEKLILEMAELL